MSSRFSYCLVILLLRCCIVSATMAVAMPPGADVLETMVLLRNATWTLADSGRFPQDAPSRILDAISSRDPCLASMAAHCISIAPLDTPRLDEMLAALHRKEAPVDSMEAAFVTVALTLRKHASMDVAARTAALEALTRSEHDYVKLEAARRLGSANDITMKTLMSLYDANNDFSWRAYQVIASRQPETPVHPKAPATDDRYLTVIGFLERKR